MLKEKFARIETSRKSDRKNTSSETGAAAASSGKAIVNSISMSNDNKVQCRAGSYADNRTVVMSRKVARDATWHNQHNAPLDWRGPSVPRGSTRAICPRQRRTR